MPRQDAWRLLWDFYTLRQLTESLPKNSALQNKALFVANEIMNTFDHKDLSSIPKARKLAEQILGEGWDAKGENIYKEGEEKETIYGIGHCHIDTAWSNIFFSPSLFMFILCPGYGLIVLLNKRSLGHGPPR